MQKQTANFLGYKSANKPMYESLGHLKLVNLCHAKTVQDTS